MLLRMTVGKVDSIELRQALAAAVHNMNENPVESDNGIFEAKGRADRAEI